MERQASEAGVHALELIRLIRSGESIEDLRKNPHGQFYLLGLHYKDDMVGPHGSQGNESE